MFIMGDWKALSAVEPAIKETKARLFPIKKGYWLRMALLAFLGGGSIGGLNYINPFQYRFNENEFKGEPGFEEFIKQAGTYMDEHKASIIALILILLVLVIFLSYLQTLMELSFFEGALYGEIALLKSIGGNLGRAIVLFLFKILLGVFTALSLFVAVIPFLIFAGGETGAIPTMVTIFFGLVWLLGTLLLSAAISLYLIDFVIPLMILKDMGAWAGLKGVIGLFRAEPWQFLLYTFLRFIVSISAGILYLLIMIPLFLIWGLVLGLLGLLVWGVSGLLGISVTSMGVLGWILAIVLFILLIIAFAFSLNILSLPIPFFVRLYSLLFLMSQDDSLGSLAPEKLKSGL